MTSTHYPSTPQLWPIGAGAAYAGISTKLLEQGIRAGDIPVTLKVIGLKRQRFVNAPELQSWLQGSGADLFAGVAK
jgi:hypothetical protein